MVKAVLTKGKYQYKRLLLCYPDNLAHGAIKDLTKSDNPSYIQAITDKWKSGDTHYIIINT